MKNHLIIVSGLPRSGTSLMMQILQAGGIPIITDDSRQADHHNPQGYLEDSRVNKLDKENRWLLNNDGKAVKITSHWLLHIPAGLPAKIVFMLRDIDEIITSQNKMLNGKTSDISYSDLKSAFKKHLQETLNWIARQKYIDYLKVNYRDVIINPQNEIAQINKYLVNELNEVAAAEVIQEDLYRNKKKELS